MRIRPAECWELLATAGFGRLAIAASGGVDIFPLNFAVDNQTIVLRTAEGSKLSEMLHEVPVALEADERDLATGRAWSVVAKGRPRVLTGAEEIEAAHALDLMAWSSTERKAHFVRIEVTELTGRRLQGAPRG